MNLTDFRTILKTVFGGVIFVLAISGSSLSQGQEHSTTPPQSRSELSKEQHAGLDRLGERNELIRKREVYDAVAKVIRMNLAQTLANPRRFFRQFNELYNLCYLWGSDEVVVALNKFVDLLAAQTDNPIADFEAQAKALYVECIAEMRKDAGHPMTKLDAKSYRLMEH